MYIKAAKRIFDLLGVQNYDKDIIIPMRHSSSAKNAKFKNV